MNEQSFGKKPTRIHTVLAVVSVAVYAAIAVYVWAH